MEVVPPAKAKGKGEEEFDTSAGPLCFCFLVEMKKLQGNTSKHKGSTDKQYVLSSPAISPAMIPLEDGEACLGLTLYPHARHRSKGGDCFNSCRFCYDFELKFAAEVPLGVRLTVRPKVS